MNPRKEQIGSCELYLGDCREIIPSLGKVDAVVTDPPYGISFFHSGGCGDESKAKATKFGGESWMVHGDDKPFDPSPFLKWPCLFWGANYFADRLPPSSHWLVWNKSGEAYARKLSFADFEMAWVSTKGPAQIFYQVWRGMARGFGDEQKAPRVHPTQKPISVMEWCLEEINSQVGQTILDPFMGSGTTGVACVRLGRRFIGCEIEPKYFDIACRRIEKAYEDQRLFADLPKEPTYTQADMFAEVA